MSSELIFNPPPGWPKPPTGWVPPRGWTPDPSWPAPPENWQLWIPTEVSATPPPLPSSGSSPSSAPAMSTTGACIAESPPIDRVAFLEAENAELRQRIEMISAGAGGAVATDDDAILQEVGIYRYHHPLEAAADHQGRLNALDAEIALAVKFGHAIEKSNLFTYDNSLAKGKKMSDDLGKLMLRAYNAEAESSVRSLRAGNVVTAKDRLERSREAIAKLGKMMEMRISEVFHGLRIREIELTADFLMKKQEEREAAKEERARLKEEMKVAAELAAERERLDKERNHILNALQTLQTQGSTDRALEEKLAMIDDAIASNDYRAANIRAGYVYIISNRGAFGADVVKIGLTRRLEPLTRVDELGDASVPFRFDVHCLFFSEDAVTLEAELHAHFASRRLNQANLRKEFFFATPAEVREVLRSKLGNLLEFNEHAEATDYHQSLHYWPEARRFQVNGGSATIPGTFNGTAD
ncbi:DUF4041 domain-containing protein [Luteolibacter soli]